MIVVIYQLNTMDSFPMHYYAINRSLLTAVGHWPFVNWPLTAFFIKLTVLSFFVTTIIMEICYFIEQKFNLHVMCEMLPIFACVVALGFMGITFNINEDLFEDLWQRMKDDWAAEHLEEETKIKKSYAALGCFLTKGLSGLVVIGVFLFIITTAFLSEILDIISPLNESRPPMLPFPAIEVFRMDGMFYTTLIMEDISTMVCMVFGVAYNSLGCMHCCHVYGMFAVIGYRLEHLVPESLCEEADNSDLINKAGRKSLVLCIRRHQAALEFSSILESYYGPPFSIYLVGSIFMVSPTLTQLADTEFHYMAVLQIFIIVIFLYLVSALGQKLIDLSSEITEKAYLSDWYRYAVKIQRLLILILKRSNKPCSINALNLFSMSLDCFRMVMQTGFSYFMVLREFQ